ncbi:MAG: hypothetical protein Q9211_002598 [Gyalolechia sp. 1 TL-2023]
MSQDIRSWQALYAACKQGDVHRVRSFLQTTLPSLSPSSQRDFCLHHCSPASIIPCSALPCPVALTRLLVAASEGSSPTIFAYLWDIHLAPRGITSIPWDCLRIAAYKGDIPLGTTFFERDRACFRAAAPPTALLPGRRDGHQQFNIAIRNDRFDYIDFMLAHGGDINVGLDGGHDILRMVVRCAADDAVTGRRVAFLASRGSKVRESGALMEVVKGGSVELTERLLRCGADVNGIGEQGGASPLMIAANEGYEDMVRLLLGLGADVGAVGRDGRDAVAMANENGHEGVERILRAWRSKTETAL